MQVRIAYQAHGLQVGWRGVDEPVATLVASGARAGFARRGTGWLEILVEEGEDVAKVRAQRSGQYFRDELHDYSEKPLDTLTSVTTDVAISSGEPDEVIFAPPRRPDGKPPYRVPTVAEVAQAAKRRRKRSPVVVSTFSGAGGSCFGYRIAGFDVRAAVEIAPVPASSYAANFPDSKVFVESIRDVDPKALLKAAGVKRGELDLFDGSPPCTSFSTAGQRAKTWGKVRKHAGVEQRIDDLFFDYAKLVDALQPKVFVAENVAGLARGAAIGYFKAILRALRDLGYLVRVQKLDADQLGVPQHRERLFFVGLRADVAKKLGYSTHEDLDDLFPRSHRWTYTVRDALPWLDPDAEAYSLQGTPFGTPERIAAGLATPPERVKAAEAAPAATILASGSRAGVRIRRETGGKNQAAEPADYLDRPSPAIIAGGSEEHGNVGANAAHYGVEVDVVHDSRGPFKGASGGIDDPSGTLRTTDESQHFVELRAFNDSGGKFSQYLDGPVETTDRPSPTVNAGSDGQHYVEAKIMSDTGGQYGRKGEIGKDEPVPTIVAGRDRTLTVQRVEHDTGREGQPARDVTDEAAPTLVNGTDDPAAGGGARNHWKVVEEGPNGTVLRRKFTILEVKRLCSFPDDYELLGTFAEQWAQCGNSVPPLMMAALAGRIRERVFDRLDRPQTRSKKRKTPS